MHKLTKLRPSNGLSWQTTWVSWYQKGETSLDLNQARDDGVLGRQWHQLDHMQTICTSLQTDNHTNTSSLNFYRPDALPGVQPTVSKQWEGTKTDKKHTLFNVYFKIFHRSSHRGRFNPHQTPPEYDNAQASNTQWLMWDSAWPRLNLACSSNTAKLDQELHIVEKLANIRSPIKVCQAFNVLLCLWQRSDARSSTVLHSKNDRMEQI